MCLLAHEQDIKCKFLSWPFGKKMYAILIGREDTLFCFPLVSSREGGDPMKLSVIKQLFYGFPPVRE